MIDRLTDKQAVVGVLSSALIAIFDKGLMYDDDDEASVRNQRARTALSLQSFQANTCQTCLRPSAPRELTRLSWLHALHVHISASQEVYAIGLFCPGTEHLHKFISKTSWSHFSFKFSKLIQFLSGTDTTTFSWLRSHSLAAIFTPSAFTICLYFAHILSHHSRCDRGQKLRCLTNWLNVFQRFKNQTMRFNIDGDYIDWS